MKLIKGMKKMKSIKMSDVFDLPMNTGDIYIDSDHEGHNTMVVASITAINAYDANQERIKELETELAATKEAVQNLKAEMGDLQ